MRLNEYIIGSAYDFTIVGDSNLEPSSNSKETGVKLAHIFWDKISLVATKSMIRELRHLLGIDEDKLFTVAYRHRDAKQWYINADEKGRIVYLSIEALKPIVQALILEHGRDNVQIVGKTNAHTKVTVDIVMDED